MRALALLLLVFCSGVALAQDQDGRARRILDKPEYKSYRIEKREYTGDRSPSPGEPGGGGGGDEEGYSRGEDGWRTEGSTPRRDARSGPARRPQSPQRQERQTGDSGSGPDLGWLGSVFEVIFWVVVVVGAAIALFFIVKALMGIKLKPKPKADKKKATRKDKPEASTGVGAQGEDEPVADEFLDALAAARRELEVALRDRDWARAALLRYRIFWLEAGWRGCVEDTDVQTWRDALRMVRQVPLRNSVREQLGLIERVRYGRHTPDEGEWREFNQRLDGIEPREVLR